MNVVYDYMRPLKAKYLKEWYDHPLQFKEDLTASVHKDAIVLPLKKFEGDDLLFGRGGVIDETGNYIPESGIEHRVYGSYDFENAECRDESVAYCGYLVDQWGHFLVEGVARLWYFLHEEHKADKYIFILEDKSDRQIKGNYRAFLELLGVWEKVEFINRPIRYKKVIIPLRAYKRFDYYTNFYKEIFERVAQQAEQFTETPRDAGSPTKVYFSRSKLRKARKLEIELDPIDAFFLENGYQVIYPEELPLNQLITIIRNADVVATMSGSVQHNMLFAKDGASLQILERFPVNIDYQVQINMIKDLNATYIDVCFPIYPTDLSGPLILGYTNCLKSFAEREEYRITHLRSERRIKQGFSRYMKAYRKGYGLSWFSLDWYFPRYSAIYEGYLDSVNVFGDYLFERKPYTVSQLFTLHFIKQCIKYIRGRFAGH